jgi:hypothetical protein
MRTTPNGAETMLKPFAVALFAIAMSVGFAQAKEAKHVHQNKRVHQTKHVHQTKRVHRHKVTATKHVQKNQFPQNNAIPMCAEGKQVTAMCACGTDASGRPFMYQEGQLCRTLAHACTQ